MTKLNCAACLTLLVLAAGAVAEEIDYYKNLRYPAKLVPGVGLDKIDQEGGAGYKRRTVQWWPRKGQDIVDIPAGAPLRTWTRNKGQKDAEATAGVCRTWTASDPETFKAHLIAFRSFGTSTYMSDDPRSVHLPEAVLRLEDGSQRAVVDYGPFSYMLSAEDHTFIHQIWEKAYPKLYAKVTQGDLPQMSKLTLKRLKDISPKFNGIEPAKDAKYPLWATAPDTIEIESPHFHTIAHPKAWGRPANWYNPNNIKRQNLWRKHVLEYIENFWTYVEASGASMPYWRRPGPNQKYQIHIWRSRCAGGWGHCGIGDCNPVALGHEFFHGQPMGGHPGGETMCNAGQHTIMPAELQMFNGNFRYPWRNMNYMAYQSSLPFFILGDNPNWGYGAQIVLGCLASTKDHTYYHTIARLGQQKGLWKNGVRGFGDFLGEYAARMVTCDFVEQYSIRSKYGMPEGSYLYPVYGHKDRYRISNAEAPRWTGYNIIRLDPSEGAKEITVDFQGVVDPDLHSDWRACIVAVDANGRARYSPLWNKGKMKFPLKPTDKHLWLTVSASPDAFPVQQGPGGRSHGYVGTFLTGSGAPRYPWEVALTGCKPGTPHRKQGDIENFDELFGRCDSGNTYLNYSVKHEVPIPLTDTDGKPAQKKLTEMLPRLKASVDALEAKVQAGKLNKGYFWSKRNMMHIDLARRIKLLQENAKGKPHPNGGGFVADSAKVAATAYVGPGAMVFDGATVKDNACIKDFAVVFGPKTVIAGNAKIGGRAWVVGDLKVTGSARILEAATVTTVLRTPRTPSVRHEGQAEITGSAVIKGEVYLHLAFAKDLKVTDGVVLDYEASVETRTSGVFSRGRFYRWSDRRAPSLSSGADAGALYANWQFNQPKTVLLEDSYVNNNGDLHGKPKFGRDREHKYFAFNGKDQYAQAPPSVADFGELTIDMTINRSGGGRISDFGTGDDECFYLSIDARNGKPSLVAHHDGKKYSLTASQGIAAGKWVRLRVEMDGSKASIYVDGKQVAETVFAFAPRMVFIGDRPEGNFIACSRDKKEFFAGKIDHFRIYRKVHKDFNAIGLPPSALIQVPEWSEEDQKRNDAWEGRRKAKDAEIAAGPYGKLQEEIKKLNKQKSDLYRTKVKSAKVTELEARIKAAAKERSDLDRKMRDEIKALPQAAKTEQEIKELRKKIDSINKQISKNPQRVKLNEEIQTCEKQRRETESKVSSPALKAVMDKEAVAAERKRKAEEAIIGLPELKKLMALSEQEKDNKKKRELQDKYKRLLAAKKAVDPEWQTAEIVLRRLSSSRHALQRNRQAPNPERKKIEARIRTLKDKLNALTAQLKKSHPELSGLEKSVRAKQDALDAKRKQIEGKWRTSDAYKKADAKRIAADKALRKARDDDKKRIEQEKSAQAAKITARIEKLQKEANLLRDSALKKAGLLGSNPHPGARAASAQAAWKQFKYHTTADWSSSVSGDGGEQDESQIPEKMKKWLKRVRGY
ncbi:MAG: DUF6055 domain-containing protein [Phycisphaerae bacterium]|jgi:hypothetical protein|nr:DUF6055 domain-containing protein [Phycisphaerae bacterium]